MNTLLCMLTAGLGNQPSPPLQCPTALAARGEVKGGPPLTHVFELTHRGTGTLSITRVEAGCGCLRQSLSSGVLQPGETAKLTVEVNTLTQPDGQNRWQVLVGYKVETPAAPPQPGELLLQITATLSREVTISPPQVGFSTAGRAIQVLTLTDTRAKPLTVVKATTSNAHLTAEVGPRNPPAKGGQTQSITVKLSPDAPAGHRDETVVLLTDDAAYPELRIPVRVLKRAAGGISVTPESVSVRLAMDQTEVSTLVQLRNPDGKAIRVSGAESDHPGVAVKWSQGAGAVAVVRVTVTDVAASQTGACKVRVKLSEPAGQEVVIPVSWSGSKKE